MLLNNHCILFARKTWVLTKNYDRKILTFERKCHRKVARIGWTPKITNKEHYTKLQPEIIPVKQEIQRKLQCLGIFENAPQ